MKMRHFPAIAMIVLFLTVILLLFCAKQLPTAPGNEFTGSISGVVKGRYPGGPLSGVLVSISSSQSALTDPSGKFTIIKVEAGTHEIHFTNPDYEDTTGITVNVATGEDVSLRDTVRLNYRYYVLKGRIVYNSSPVPYAGVALGNTPISVLSTDGTFILDKVPKILPIKLICAKTKIGFGIKDVDTSQLVANGVTDVQDIVLDKEGATVSGIVYDPASKPLPNIIVNAVGGGLVDTTNTDGSYSLENVPSNTSVRIYVPTQGGLTGAVSGFRAEEKGKLDGIDIRLQTQADLAAGNGMALTVSDLLVSDTAHSVYLSVYPTTDDTTIITNYNWTLAGKSIVAISTTADSLDLTVDSLKHIAQAGSKGMIVHVTVVAVNSHNGESKPQSFDVTLSSTLPVVTANGSDSQTGIRKDTVSIEAGNWVWLFGGAFVPFGGIDSLQWDFGDNTPQWVSTDTLKSISHKYSNEGTFLAVFSVLDASGNRVADTVVVKSIAPSIAKPTLVSPADGDTNRTSVDSVTLVWNKVADASVSYAVYFDSLNNPIAKMVTDTTLRVKIDSGRTVWWTVEAVKAGKSGPKADLRRYTGRCGKPVNHLPVFSTTPAQMISIAMVGSAYRDTVLATDADSDPVRYSFIDSVAGMSLGLTNGIVQWTTAKNDTGAHIISIAASDGRGGLDTLTWTITVVSIPKVTLVSPADGDTNKFIDDSVTLVWNKAPGAYKVYLDSLNNPPVTYVAQGLIDTTLRVKVDSGRTVYWAVAAVISGIGGPASDARLYKGRVGRGIPVNHSPVFLTTPAQMTSIAKYGTLYCDTLLATDADGDIVQYSFIDSVAGMTIGSTSGIIKWTPLKTDAGAHPISVRASDSHGGINILVWTLTVGDSYPIIYDGNGNTGGSVPSPQTKTQGTPLLLSGNTGTLVKTGYTFVGWNTAADGSGTDYAAAANYTADAGVTLYAKWTNLPTYTVTYNGNSNSGGSVPSPQIKISGVSLTLSGNTGALVKTGCTFAGWNTAADGSGTDYAAGVSYTTDAGVILYAKWTTLPTYTVTYNGNGNTSGTVPAAQTKTTGIPLTLSGNTGTLVKTGNTFAGWNTVADGSGTDYSAGASYTADAGVTLYAKWTTLPTFTVTYNGNGNTSGTVPAAQTKTSGVPLTLSGNTGALVKTGSTFVGWNTAANGSGTDYAAGASYTTEAGVILYAKWTTLPTYTITYNGNGNTSGAVPAAQTKTTGTPLTLSGNTGALAKTGYTFAGWNTAADGSGTDYSAGASYTADAGVTLYAKWTTLPTFTVTYNGNGNTGGAAPAAQTKTSGVPLTLSGNTGALVKTGSTFVGWNTAADGSGTDYAAGASYTTEAGVILYAKWTTLPTYTITYNGNGNTSGAVPAAQTKTTGTPLTLSGNNGALVKTGSTFAGWNTAADGSGTDYAAGASYTADAGVTLYAKWTTLPTFTVTYNGNGNTSGTVPAAQTKTTGTPLTLSGNTGTLVKTGYTFAGWNTAVDGSGTDYAAGASYTADAALTLYAKWTTLPTYTITYNGNANTSGTAPAAQIKTSGTPLTLSGNTGALVKTGYTFAGWNTAADGSGTDYAAGASYITEAGVTLYAKWTIQTFTVTYNGNSNTGGTAPPTQTKTYGVSLTISGNTGTLLRTGYTFSGWNTAADGSGTDYLTGASYTTEAGVTLYAKWTQVYAVIYNGNGNTSGTIPPSQTKINGIPLTLSGNTGALANTGSTFAGWNTAADGSGTDYAAGASYTTEAGLTLYAKWTVQTYTVAFNGNGNTGGAVPANQIKTYNVLLAISSNTGSLIKTGYTFAGWNTAADGSGTDYAAGASYTNNAGITLYAKWTPQTFTVTYNGNGNDGGAVPASQIKTYGISLTLSGNTGALVMTGYTFAGWNTLADGTGADYAAGASYTANAGVTLYAKWTVQTFTVTYNGNGNTGGSVPAAQQKTYVTNVLIPGNTGTLVKTGLVFAGWNTAANGSGTDYMPGTYYTNNADVTLYAKWNVGWTDNVTTLTDPDGNTYHTVTIGTQVWMVENLQTTKYNDGISIPLITGDVNWGNQYVPAYCWYGDNIANKGSGALYNWYTVNTGKLAPPGWHVPTDADYTTLSTYLGGDAVAGGKMKSTSSPPWQSPNTGATNSSGFAAIPGGDRSDINGFSGQIAYADFWTSTEYPPTGSTMGYYRELRYNGTYITAAGTYQIKKFGMSVRLVKG